MVPTRSSRPWRHGGLGPVDLRSKGEHTEVVTEPLASGKTVFFYDGEPFAVLTGAISVPPQSRVQLGERDYIVNNVRVRLGSKEFDLYYDCHQAESSGTVPSFLD